MSDDTDHIHVPGIANAVAEYLRGEITARQLEDALPDGELEDGSGYWRNYALEVRQELSRWMYVALNSRTALDPRTGVDISLTKWLDEKRFARPAHNELADALAGITSRHAADHEQRNAA